MAPEAVAELQAHAWTRKLRHLPIIMITSRTGEKHRDHAFSLGVNKYLGKPYQEDLLLNSIRELLGRTVN